VLVLVLLLLVLAQRWHDEAGATSRLDRASRELDETDPGWRLEDLFAAAPALADKTNSARLVAAVAARLPGNWPPLADLEPDEGTPANERLSTTPLWLLEKELRELADLREKARRLADMPHGRHNLEVDPRAPLLTPMEDQQRTRRVALLLKYDAVWRVHQGDLAGALRSCRAGLNAARSLGDEPTTTGQLIRAHCVRVAADTVERCLALGEAAETTLAALQAMLVEEEDHPGAYLGWRGERAMLDRTLAGLAAGTLRLGETGSDCVPAELTLRERLLGRTIAQVAHRDRPLLLDLASRAVEISRLPEHEQSAAERDLESDVREAIPKARFAQMLLPALARLGPSQRRKLARVRCLRVLLAVERYRLKHQAWPKRLADLEPEFLAEVPLDPFDGKPIRYRRLADGVMVSCPGDGGKQGRRRSALSYRLWDVQERGQPARPAPSPGRTLVRAEAMGH
jgi:hypothetical protein